MDCPIDKVSLVPRRLESEVEVDTCPICSGVWLSAAELDALRASHAHDRVRPVPDSVQASFEMARQELLPPGLCPICSLPMSRREYGYFSQVMIDSCARGHGIWLDAGELETLERFFAHQQAHAPEATPVRTLWARLVAALKGEDPIG